MSTFTTNDPIFKTLKETHGVDPIALQNLINALNQNTYGITTTEVFDDAGRLASHNARLPDGRPLNRFPGEELWPSSGDNWTWMTWTVGPDGTVYTNYGND